MQLSNYHSHCTFCDGRSYPEEFIKFALAHHFRAYGFSSHSPLPFETFWNMSKEDMPDYLTEIGRLKQKYKDRIEIYIGLEIDYLDETYNPSVSYFRDLPLDYRIGSVHFLPVALPLSPGHVVTIDGPYAELEQAIRLHYGGSVRRLVAQYFESSMRMVESGGIDIVGHLDKIYMNSCLNPDFNFEAEWYQRPFNSYLDLIAEKGLMVEINTKNLTRKRQTFPRAEYLPRLRQRNIPVMVNSDCHYPDLVNDGRKEAFELLLAAGYGSTRELVQGKWQDVPID
ncbi:histidinol-phosphatase [Parabacteroides sp. Marseille-P3160]|uniref:histidinol-phosphatase n=1 Tax=Parabacteroides sp. Marseille-P3160 TaxID=1917887 RepID=UPI0009BA249B|nr:histidinol-phosphatase [Parabacteroides sp. Marseille-P3160]